MHSRQRYLLFLVWFGITITAQVLLFSNGFLLSRVTQPKNASCSEPPAPVGCNETGSCTSILDGIEGASTTCLSPRSKVILLIVDAFRYDFAVFNESVEDPLPYQNKLPQINNLLKSEPKKSRLFKFLADPPTTTMQRLKGLTTGSLPTFIDAGSNFATHEINEDNIIDQINSKNYKAIFMGDDTWEGLYPNRFLRSFPFPSFNVWDLDTVDYGITKHLYPEMKESDWNLLIGHFLGVDHCGHRYGPDHPEMSRKLGEIDGVIKKVVEEMDENTTLFVIGDHGMTTTGDHGGESENEITAAMFVHSKMDLTPKQYTHNDTVKQVDLVPTLSTILGVPIPHSNLGSVIYDVLPLNAAKEGPNWHRLLFAAWANVLQLTSYIDEYARDSGSFDKEKLEKMHAQLSVLSMKLPYVTDERIFKEFAWDVYVFIKGVRDMCEEVWIQFDAFSMARGLLLLSHVVIFVYLIVDGLSHEDLQKVLSKGFLLICYSGFVISAAISFALHYANFTDNIVNMTYFISGFSAIIILGYTVIKSFSSISQTMYENSKTRRWSDVVCRIIITFSALMLFSNSFILEEAKVTLFFLMTLIFVLVIEFSVLRVKSLKLLYKNKVLILALAACALLRYSTNYWRCREEMGCDNYIFAKDGQMDRLDWLKMTLALASVVIGARMWLRSCGNLNGFGFNVLHARYLPNVAAVCSAGFWILHRLPKEQKVKLLGPWQPDILAWVVYAVTSTGAACILVNPLCVYQLSNEPEVEVDAHSPTLISQLAKYVFANRNKPKGSTAPTVYGLATAYTAPFVITAINLTLLWTMLLGDAITPSCIALIYVAVFILITTAIIQYEKSTSVEDLITTSSTSVLLWFVLSVYSFYGTGHQPSFPSIAWEAAFVGTGGVFNVNFIPATLVVLNTFGSYMLFAVTLPLTHIAPFTLYAMYPGLSRKTKVDLSKGDLTYYDNSEVGTSNLFKMYCKYIMCHALRIFCSMLSATIHCRHLMVWNIFAPKLIFEAFGLFVTVASSIFGYVLYSRIDSAMEHLVRGLSKQSS